MFASRFGCDDGRCSSRFHLRRILGICEKGDFAGAGGLNGCYAIDLKIWITGDLGIEQGRQMTERVGGHINELRLSNDRVAQFSNGRNFDHDFVARV